MDDYDIRAPKVETIGRYSLEDYGSYTYRITFACVKKYITENNNHDLLESRPNSYWIVARNYGKGNSTYKNQESIEETLNKFKNNQIKDTIKGFLKDSPGKYDFYIDNLEINSAIGFTNQTGVAAHTKLTFDVIEPYSMNGFLEALQMSATAMGYESYLGVPFVLTLDFVGYRDNKDIDSPPEIIPLSTRRFFVILYKIDIHIDETGTKYKVEALPFNEISYASNANKLKKNIQASGTTVGEILSSLLDGIKQQAGIGERDTYSIKFPIINKEGNIEWDSTENDISKSKVRDITKLNGLVEFPTVGKVNVVDNYGAWSTLDRATQAEAIRNSNALGISVTEYLNATNATIQFNQSPSQGTIPTPVPTQDKKYVQSTIDPTTLKPLVQFPENFNITDVITSVVNGSDYIKKIIDRITNNQNFKFDETIDYYQIQTDIKIINAYNEKTQRPDYHYTYYVLPYSVHHSRVSLKSNIIQVPKEELLLNKNYIKSYSYSYTGNNQKIIDFKMDVNLYFYNPVPRGFDRIIDKDQNSAKRLTSIEKTSDTIKGSSESVATMGYPDSAKRNYSFLNIDAGKTKDNYATMAQMLHYSFLQTAGLQNLEMTILGDIELILTAGMGNYRPKILPYTGTNRLKNGELNHLDRNLAIRLIFNNPTDIDKDTGELKFRNKFDTFSGVYTLIGIVHKFNQGVFTQNLSLKKILSQADLLDNLSGILGEIDNSTSRFQNRTIPQTELEQSVMGTQYRTPTVPNTASVPTTVPDNEVIIKPFNPPNITGVKLP